MREDAKKKGLEPRFAGFEDLKRSVGILNCEFRLNPARDSDLNPATVPI